MSIHYIENRLWFLGAKVLLKESSSGSLSINLGKFVHRPNGEVEELLCLPETASAAAEPAAQWTLDAKYPDAVIFRLDDESDEAIRRYVAIEDGWPCRTLRLSIHSSGFLQILSHFELVQPGNQAKLETTTEMLQESIDRLLPFLVYLADQAHDSGIIKKSSLIHFGVPNGEPMMGEYELFGSNFHAGDAFSYNQHFILENDEEAAELAKTGGLSNEKLEIDGIDLRWGRSMRVWSGPTDKIHEGLSDILAAEPREWKPSVTASVLVQGFYVDSLLLGKLAVTSTAETVYSKLLLRIAREEESSKPEKLRAIMDLINGILHQLCLYDWRLNEDQSKIQTVLDEKAQVNIGIESFRSAEANLVASTEGMESLASRQLSSAMEAILFVLTILSVYSIAADVASFLGSGDDLRFLWPPFRLRVITAATAIIVLFVTIVLYRRMSLGGRRKLRKRRS